MKTILFIFASFLLAGEMELDGNLKVTGNIDANGNPITNVGAPLNATDAVNLASIQGLGGMKPERIYILPVFETMGEIKIVPAGKVWAIIPMSTAHTEIELRVNGTDVGWIAGNDSYPLPLLTYYALPGQEIQLKSQDNLSRVAIYEYSITSTGTDQGMNYVEP